MSVHVFVITQLLDESVTFSLSDYCHITALVTK